MASGPEHFAAAEQALALAASSGSAMAARIGEGHAQLAQAASNVALAMQTKPQTTAVTDDMKAWTAATKSTGAIAAIKVGDDGQIVPTASATAATTTAKS